MLGSGGIAPCILNLATGWKWVSALSYRVTASYKKFSNDLSNLG